MQSISELYAECPICRVSSTNRLISVSNFALKGSGWYADGYSHSPNKKLPEE
jgi:predicted nucleic acid-binding Zn ribbon protein